ncbi:replication protein A 70 kDa DNA-binding subunit B-like [Ananas comosus]|uniref:Replication protein A 70 kDa DNA-binding subunit B-like n=1 Tax=Ananas comosus TaxID=4615 RepID=A0A6P5GNK7_ANACO|nr:replication protein A 70 kDa DNA-binding subunit B-like [Ananas comosus]
MIMKGYKIQGFVYGNDVGRLDKIIFEGKIYTFFNIRVRLTTAGLKITANDYECVITSATKVEEVTEGFAKFPNYAYSFVALEKLGKLINNKVLIDVAGMIVHVEKAEFIKGRDGNRPKREIIIMNKSRWFVRLTLWDSLVTTRIGMWKDAIQKKLIIVATALHVDFRKGVCLSTSFATKILINPQIAEVEEIKRSLL